MDRLIRTATEGHRETSTPPGRLSEVLALDASQVEAERARMEGTDTAERWTELADAWASIGRPFRSAMSRWRAAEAAEAAEDRDGAVTALRETHAIASDLGAGPLLRHLEQMARRLRVRLGRAAGSTGKASDAAYGLTRRELEVLREVAAGRTNREIAETLFISESTAGVHVSNILGKLGVSTRTEAARVALDQGLVGEPD
jgi:DNA-binding CsgD family transcriptional regulator